MGISGGQKPTLLVGTHVDRAASHKAGTLAQDLSASSVDINNLSSTAMASGSVLQKAVHEYFAAVVAKKFRGYASGGGRRRQQAGGGSSGGGMFGGMF